MTAAMGRPDTPLPEAVDVAVVGGGIMGLALAYHLAMFSGTGTKGKPGALSIAVMNCAGVAAIATRPMSP